MVTTRDLWLTACQPVSQSIRQSISQGPSTQTLEWCNETATLLSELGDPNVPGALDFPILHLVALILVRLNNSSNLIGCVF